MMSNYYPKQLSGDQTKTLLTNPDRGFRFEVYLDVKTGKSIYEYADQDTIVALKREASLYTNDQPRIVQVYFYLTGYQHKPLDAQAFSHMNAFFDELAKLNLKALLRFAYISEDKRPYRQAAQGTAAFRTVIRVAAGTPQADSRFTSWNHWSLG